MRKSSLPMLVLRVGLAGAWAGLLVLAGLWALNHGAARFPALGRLWLVGGLTCLFMGQFVFCAAVADRLFPHVHPRLQAAVEVGTGAGFVSGLVVLVALLLGALP